MQITKYKKLIILKLEYKNQNMYENKNTTFAQSGANLVQITRPSAHQMLRSARIQNIAIIGLLSHKEVKEIP